MKHIRLNYNTMDDNEETAEQFAQRLFEEGTTSKQYERQQATRRARLEFWESQQMEPMIQQEKGLVAFGEEVYNYLVLLETGYNKRVNGKA